MKKGEKTEVINIKNEGKGPKNAYFWVIKNLISKGGNGNGE